MSSNIHNPKEYEDAGTVAGVPGTEKHPRGADTSADAGKNKGGRPSKDANTLKHKPKGAADTSRPAAEQAQKTRAQRAAEYDKRAKPAAPGDIKAAAREKRRKERFIEKGY